MANTNERARRASAAAAALAAGLLASACGGGGDGSPVIGNDPSTSSGPVGQGSGSVPPEASGSVAAMLAWARSQGTSDTAEPLRTHTFRPPLDESTETSPG